MTPNTSVAGAGSLTGTSSVRRRLPWLVGVVLVVLLVATVAVFVRSALRSGPPGSFSVEACELLTQGQVENLTGDDVSSVTLEDTDLGRACIYRLSGPTEIWVSLQFVSEDFGATVYSADDSWTRLDGFEGQARVKAYGRTATRTSATVQVLVEFELLEVRVRDFAGSEARVVAIAEELGRSGVVRL